MRTGKILTIKHIIHHFGWRDIGMVGANNIPASKGSSGNILFVSRRSLLTRNTLPRCSREADSKSSGDVDEDMLNY
jgi:hypothetical protein